MVLVVALLPVVVFLLLICVAFAVVHVVSVSIPFPSRVVDRFVVIPGMIIIVRRIESAVRNAPGTTSNDYGK